MPILDSHTIEFFSRSPEQTRRIGMRIGGEISVAKQGEVIVIPRNTPHGFRNLLDTASTMLAIITPSGFENFFAEMDRLKHADMAKIVEIGKRNDLELVV